MALGFRTVGLAPDYVDYTEALALQRSVHADVAAGTADDVVLLLEHREVYTAGKRTEDWERPSGDIPVIDADRGGKITWHGPGQLVGYPILRLPDPVDVVEYVRTLEAMLIDVCERFGVPGERVEGRSGVWLPADAAGSGARPARKIAAIGIRVAANVTMHGFALNCDNSLEAYSTFVPCGITDAGVASLSEETGRDVTPHDAAAAVREVMPRYFPSSSPAPDGDLANVVS
ncbi:lipoyl(octanoyl) transferase LipB [Spelaeicoccus albus]|uniref:Octanoyltransferase n=1 Tax=Spelaeicoccus albus TaxID=1280376 RepID=A0A7Z0IIA2_9MICO|nr:lipoyl(octanoyl) transferase LipB [Spelaeicoccus albus]NYI68328.1 lipoyl(octanoyl) transferase [Spelaeicoccus albus]